MGIFTDFPLPSYIEKNTKRQGGGKESGHKPLVQVMTTKATENTINKAKPSIGCCIPMRLKLHSIRHIYYKSNKFLVILQLKKYIKHNRDFPSVETRSLLFQTSSPLFEPQCRNN